MNVAKNWKEYELIDMANGEKLERWGDILLIRPDPQIIWREKQCPDLWSKANARYQRSKTGGGAWEYKKRLPEAWQVHYKNLTFNIKPMGFKHTGLFPEQAVNWYIVDDAFKFVNREIRRGNNYDAIIMDPPSYGRGANGEVWQFEENISEFVQLCMKVLSDDPLFFLINSYTTGISARVLENILNLNFNKKYKGNITSGEIGLPMKSSRLILPCGIFGRWEK